MQLPRCKFCPADKSAVCVQDALAVLCSGNNNNAAPRALLDANTAAPARPACDATTNQSKRKASQMSPVAGDRNCGTSGALLEEGHPSKRIDAGKLTDMGKQAAQMCALSFCSPPDKLEVWNSLAQAWCEKNLEWMIEVGVSYRQTSGLLRQQRMFWNAKQESGMDPHAAKVVKLSELIWSSMTKSQPPIFSFYEWQKFKYEELHRSVAAAFGLTTPEDQLFFMRFVNEYKRSDVYLHARGCGKPPCERLADAAECIKKPLYPEPDDEELPPSDSIPAAGADAEAQPQPGDLEAQPQPVDAFEAAVQRMRNVRKQQRRRMEEKRGGS